MSEKILPNKTTYMVITESSAERLSATITNMIGLGYATVGGVSVVYNASGYTFAQAMIIQ